MVSIMFALLSMLFIQESEACSISFSNTVTANFKKTFTVTGLLNDIVTLSKTSGPGSFTGISSLTGTISSGTSLNIDAYMTLPGNYVINVACSSGNTGSLTIQVYPAVFTFSLSPTVFFI